MKKRFLGPYIIGSAIIWGVTIIGASLAMKGAANKTQVLSLLSIGATLHLILVWGPLAANLRKLIKAQAERIVAILMTRSSDPD